MTTLKEFLKKYETEDEKRSTSGVINNRFYRRIVEFLKDKSAVNSAHFRYFVTSKGFRIVDVPNFGLFDILIAPKSKADVNTVSSNLFFNQMIFYFDLLL